MRIIVAGIDVHKKMLLVAVLAADQPERECACRRFGATGSELQRLAVWLKQCGVTDAVMESTAQYWKPVWLALEPDFRLHLAQAQSNRAPKGRKTDFRDAQRLARRFLVQELLLSFVPGPEQRAMRTLTRRRVQLVRDKVRLQSQLECLLEEMQVKLSSVLTDLLGASGRRILAALAAGETDPDILAQIADRHLQCPGARLRDALPGSLSPIHRRLLTLYLEQLALLETQMETVAALTATLLHPYQCAVTALCAVPGIGVLSAHAIIAEAGPTAATFESAAHFTSWIGLCPGSSESAGVNHSGRCPQGNRFLRRTLCQVAQAAIKTKNCRFQVLFYRLLPRLGYQKAVWAVARHIAVVTWHILHRQVPYHETGAPTTPQASKRRAQRLLRQLRSLGYDVPLSPDAVSGQTG